MAKFKKKFLYFGRLLLLKVYTISVKKSTEELCLLILKTDAKFEQKLICCFKIDKNLVNFDPGTQKSPKFALTEELSFMTLKSNVKFE